MVLALYFLSVFWVFFSSLSQSKACDESLVKLVNSMAQLPYDAIDYLPEENFWTVLSNHDAKGSKKQLDYGKLSSKDVVEVTITYNGSKKSKTSHEYNTKNSIKKADGSIIYTFICSSTMIGLVECKNSKSSPLLYTLAKMVNPQSDVSGEIDGCKKLMNKIHPKSTVQQLAHP